MANDELVSGILTDKKISESGDGIIYGSFTLNGVPYFVPHIEEINGIPTGAVVSVTWALSPKGTRVVTSMKTLSDPANPDQQPQPLELADPTTGDMLPPMEGPEATNPATADITPPPVTPSKAGVISDVQTGASNSGVPFGKFMLEGEVYFCKDPNLLNGVTNGSIVSIQWIAGTNGKPVVTDLKVLQTPKIPETPAEIPAEFTGEGSAPQTQTVELYAPDKSAAENTSTMGIYNRYRAVPPEAQKPISAGRIKGFTDINPQWRIMCLTKEFGPAGFGWKTQIIEQRLEPVELPNGKKEIKAFLTIGLFINPAYKERLDTGKSKAEWPDNWSDPIIGLGGSSFLSNENSGPYVSDEAFKMAYTDAISVACKLLGIGADVYWANGATKYR